MNGNKKYSIEVFHPLEINGVMIIEMEQGQAVSMMFPYVFLQIDSKRMSPVVHPS